MPTYFCPRCGGNDAYYAPRQIGVNVENWSWNPSSGAVRRQPNSTQWKNVNQALCRNCGEIIQIRYSRKELNDQAKRWAKGALYLLGGLVFLIGLGALIYIDFIAT
jgi:hypothetical protein